MSEHEHDKKWIDALAKLAEERGDSNIIKTYSDNPRSPKPSINAYKTLKAFLERFAKAVPDGD